MIPSLRRGCHAPICPMARCLRLSAQGIQRCRRKPQSQNAYLYCALGCMAAQLGRVGEARAWFEEGSRTAEGAASVALWQVGRLARGDSAVVVQTGRSGLAGAGGCNMEYSVSDKAVLRAQETARRSVARPLLGCGGVTPWQAGHPRLRAAVWRVEHAGSVIEGQGPARVALDLRSQRAPFTVYGWVRVWDRTPEVKTVTWVQVGMSRRVGGLRRRSRTRGLAVRPHTPAPPHDLLPLFPSLQAWAVLEAKQGDPTAVRYLFRKALQANAKSRCGG